MRRSSRCCRYIAGESYVYIIVLSKVLEFVAGGKAYSDGVATCCIRCAIVNNYVHIGVFCNINFPEVAHILHVKITRRYRECIIASFAVYEKAVWNLDSDIVTTCRMHDNLTRAGTAVAVWIWTGKCSHKWVFSIWGTKGTLTTWPRSKLCRITTVGLTVKICRSTNDASRANTCWASCIISYLRKSLCEWANEY